MREIPLTQSQVALVDDEDFDRVNQFKWYAAKEGDNYYAARTTPEKKTQFLHQFILGQKADHRDGNGLDNRRENLRPATQKQNNRAHRRKASSASSSFRGVCRGSGFNGWKAQICVDYRVIHLGYFEDEENAARAYDAAARKYFGEFAAPNFPICP